MIICPICNAQLEDDAKFCTSCGVQFMQPSDSATYQQQEYQQVYQQPAAQPKKKKTGLIAIVALALLVLSGIGIFAEKLFQSQGYGSGVEKPGADVSATEEAGKPTKAPQTAGDPTKATEAPSGDVTVLSGTDVFQGERFDEMLWGYYKAEGYHHNGSRDDSKAFREGMKFIKLKYAEGKEQESSALPLSMSVGSYSHFMSTFTYENEYYEPFTPKGRAMFRKAYMAQFGDLTEEDFLKIEKILDLQTMEVYFCTPEGGTFYTTLAYKIDGNQLLLHTVNVDDKYNILMSEKPVLQYSFLHDGGKLTLGYQGVIRSYCTNGYQEKDSALHFSGYALNEKNRYSDLAGLSFWGDETDVFPKLSNGNRPRDPKMTIDHKTGAFTLSWTKCWGEDAQGYTIEIDDPRTITGTVIPCVGYGFVDYSGFILIIDGKQYRYLMSEEEYEENLADLAGGGELSDNQLEEIDNAKRNLLAELVKAFNDAGITVSVDEGSGKIALEASFMFATGSYELSADGKKYLDSFMNVYTSVVLKEEYAAYISKIVVEGHTDTAGSYATNQTLSQNRADAVAKHCIAGNPKIKDVIEAIGYSYDYPIYNDDGTVNMAASRRVSFSFVFSGK